MSNMKKKILLIVNPCAGRTKSRAGTFDIVDKFSKNDYEFTVRTTTCQGDATNIVKRELDKHDMVVCCGGDGTLNETVNGVMDMPRRVPIGYIPSGTTNDLATTLGIPKDIGQATELIMSGQLNDYDIGLFNNRYFTYVACFGAFTRTSHATNQKLKNKFGYIAYLPTAIPDAFNIKRYKFRIEHDEGVIEDTFVYGSVSNSTSVGGFFKFKEGEVKMNDGYFELLLCKDLKFKSIIPALYKVRHQDYDERQFIYLRTKKLKITSLDGEVDWTLDGEYGGKHTDVMIHVLGGAVHICSKEGNPLFEKHEKPVFEPAKTDDESAAEEVKVKKRFKKRKAQKDNAETDTEAIQAEADTEATEQQNESAVQL